MEPGQQWVMFVLLGVAAVGAGVAALGLWFKEKIVAWGKKHNITFFGDK